MPFVPTSFSPLNHSATAELAKLYEACSQPGAGPEDRALFHDALIYATGRVKAITTIKDVHTITQYWVDYFDLRIRANKPTHIDILHGIDHVLRIVLEHDLLRDWTRDETRNRMLAWMCLSRIDACEGKEYYGLPTYAATLISRWSGVPVGDIFQKDLPACVNLLFGTGVWELYGTDMPSTTKVPSYLYQSALNPLPLSTSDAQVEDTPVGDLPNNF